jgi:hypothetical protein
MVTISISPALALPKSRNSFIPAVMEQRGLLSGRVNRIIYSNFHVKIFLMFKTKVFQADYGTQHTLSDFQGKEIF